MIEVLFVKDWLYKIKSFEKIKNHFSNVIKYDPQYFQEVKVEGFDNSWNVYVQPKTYSQMITVTISPTDGSLRS